MSVTPKSRWKWRKSPHGWWQSDTPECWRVTIQVVFMGGPFCVDFEHKRQRASFVRPFKSYHKAMRWAEDNLPLVNQMIGNKPKEPTE
jgi:hypothetical protein